MGKEPLVRRENPKANILVLVMQRQGLMGIGEEWNQ
jgi:hypothetical protein